MSLDKCVYAFAYAEESVYMHVCVHVCVCLFLFLHILFTVYAKKLFGQNMEYLSVLALNDQKNFVLVDGDSSKLKNQADFKAFIDLQNQNQVKK